VQHAVLDEQHHQVAPRVAAAEVLEPDGLAAHFQLVGCLEGLVRKRAGGRAVPVWRVEVQQVVARPLRRQHLGARGEGGVPVRVIPVVVRVDDGLHRPAADLLGHLADTPPCMRKVMLSTITAPRSVASTPTLPPSPKSTCTSSVTRSTSIDVTCR
jgi:hypothetical protein